MALRLSPKRFLAIISAILTFYSLARVAVLFFEALAVVREGRNEDYELLELCQRGDARGSAKMREACLKARAELASPVVFKAVTVAVSTAFKDFSDTVGNPFKFGVLVLFVISSVVLPIVPWCRALFGQHVVEPMAPYNGMHFISYAPPPDNRGRLRRIGSRLTKKLRLRTGPTIEEPDDDDEEDRFSELEPGNGTFTSTKPGAATSGAGWTSIDIMSGLPFGGRPSSPSRSHAKFD
jgi:hypothetical protein